jgi:RNA polymerase sigma-70 factor (ECF subfamily)
VGEAVAMTFSDPQLFRCVIEKFQYPLYSYIRRASNLPPQKAEEVLQEAFLKAYTHLQSYDSSLKFENWLYRIVHNQLIDWIRQRKTQPASLTSANKPTHGGDVFDALDGLPHQTELGDEIQGREQAALLQALIRALPEPYRNAAVLRWLEDEEYSEISDILCLPIGTVGSLLQRARKMIRKRLDQENGVHS